MIKRYYIPYPSDLRIIELMSPEESYGRGSSMYDTYKEAVEALIKMHDEAMLDKLHDIEQLVLQKQRHCMQLAKILLDKFEEIK